MKRPVFLADHDFDGRILDGLLKRDPSIRVIRLRDVQMHRAQDDDVLAFAAQHRMLLLSRDRNTMTAAAYERIRNGLPMHGLFIARQQSGIAQTIDALLLVAQASDADEWKNKVIYIS